MEGEAVWMLSHALDSRRLDGVDGLEKGLGGGIRCVAIVAVSWGCLYSAAVSSLLRV